MCASYRPFCKGKLACKKDCDLFFCLLFFIIFLKEKRARLDGSTEEIMKKGSFLCLKTVFMLKKARPQGRVQMDCGITSCAVMFVQLYRSGCEPT